MLGVAFVDLTGMPNALLQEGTRFKGSFIVTSGRRRGPGHILCFATPVGQPDKQLAVKLFGSAADWQQEKALLEHPYSSDDLPGEQPILEGRLLRMWGASKSNADTRV